MRAPLQQRRAPRAAARSAAPPRRCSATGRRAGRRPESRTTGRHHTRVRDRGSRSSGAAGDSCRATKRALSDVRESRAVARLRKHRGSAAGRERRLPRSVFDYIDGGADGEVTLRENVRAFEDIAFRPRCAVETPPPDLATTRARHADRAAGHPRAGRQQPHVLAARRRGRGRGRRIRRHDLLPLDAVGLPARGREEVDAGPGVVPALSVRRTRRRRARRSSARATSATPR